MKTKFIRVTMVLCLSSFMFISAAWSQGLVTVDGNNWTETAVRRVLHIFAYGGFAADSQIKTWAGMAPQNAIREMLTFSPVNILVSPKEDDTAVFGTTLEELQAFFSGNDPANPLCPDDRRPYAATNTRADGEVVLRNLGLQNTWIAAVNKRGLNPFPQKIGFWLVNYHMAVNLHDTEPPLIRELYDSALGALAQGAPFHEVLALGSSSAAVAREYGHRNNRWVNSTKTFNGNDDFAREFHQLFFRINGVIEDPDYHENTTIEHTAWALTGMQLDKEPNAYGTTLARDWWVAPIDFSNHQDLTGRRVNNSNRHHRGDLEILHSLITGATAEDKLYNLARIAITHQESLDNLPVSIINFFADDNLTEEKIAAIRTAWSSVAGQPDDLLRFIQAYAISTAFHQRDTYKYRTAFSRNMGIYNLNTVNNEESYGNSYSPRAIMNLQGAEPFIPVHDVFGGQTSLNAANNPDLFKEAYNSSVNSPNRIAKTSDACKDDLGNNIAVWRKDWVRLVPPDQDGVFRANRIGEWLWQRFISDGLENYGPLERAYVNGLLATGYDLGFIVDANNPDNAYSEDDLKTEPILSIVKANESAILELDNNINSIRREANRRVGMAVNFITMTPFMFATEGATGFVPPVVNVSAIISILLLDF